MAEKIEIDQQCQVCAYVCKNKWRDGDRSKVGPLCYYLARKSLIAEKIKSRRDNK